VHDLRELISQRVEKRSASRMSILIESFGFKNGIPGDADYRLRRTLTSQSLLGPALRATHRARPRRHSLLESQAQACRAWPTTSCSFVAARIPEHQTRIAATSLSPSAATGGRHRSVYLAERIAERLSHNYPVDRHPAQFPRRNALHHARPDTHQRPVRVPHS